MNLQLSLGTRLNIIIITINVIIFGSVLYLANASSTALLRSDAVNRFQNKSSNAFNQVDAQLLSIEAFTQQIAQEMQMTDSMAFSAEINQTVIDLLANAPDIGLIHNVNILRPDGTVIQVSPNALNQQIPDLRVVSAATQNDTPDFNAARVAEVPSWFVQESAAYDLENQQTITVAIPYENAGDSGLVWVDITLVDFQAIMIDSLNRVGLLADTNEGYVLVTDAMNNVLEAENINPQITDLDTTASILWNRLSEAGSGRNLIQVQDPFNDNREGLIRIQSFTSNDWNFITVLPAREIPIIPVEVYFPVILIGITGIIILTYVVTRFMKTVVIDPLVDLGRSAAEIGEGNLRFIVFHKDKQNEIGRLAKAMDSMRSRLRESYDELEQWSYTLESRVDERTNQLGIAQRQAEGNARQLQAIYDESLSVVNESKLEPVLDTFIDRILQLQDASYCSVWLIEENLTHVRLVATNDTRRRITTGNITMNVTQGLVGQAIRLDQPIIINDYANYEHRVILTDHFAQDNVPFHRGVCAPLKFAGSNIGAVVVGRGANDEPFDIESQKQLMLFANMVSPSVRNAQLFSELQQAVQDAKKANEVKTRFLASVTHELRTPLNLVINNIDFMRVGAFGDVNEEQISRLNQTVRSAEHLLYLINDLLDVSKIDAGEMQLFIQKQEIYTMLEDAVDNAFAMIDYYDDKADKVEIRVDIEDNLPEIPVDARRIRQVLNNLLSNGIKFTEEGTVTLKVFQMDEGVHFTVHDTGMGIPQSEMPKLFAAFERTDAAKQHGIEGTGLGMPISRYLVQQHSSDLTVSSEVGVGTTFAFTLPFDTRETIVRSMSDTQEIVVLTPTDEN